MLPRIGIFGQEIYVNHATRVLIVKFSTTPVAPTVRKWIGTFLALDGLSSTKVVDEGKRRSSKLPKCEHLLRMDTFFSVIGF